MELPEGSLVNGYVIKRKICASELYSVYEAVDKSNRTFIVKAIPETAQDLSYLSSQRVNRWGHFTATAATFCCIQRRIIAQRAVATSPTNQ